MKPVSKTAYYCCGVRALDAATPHPLCGDAYADRFMTPEAWALFEPFRGFSAPNASNVVRHRIIDDLLRARLERAPDTQVVVLGAGFDTRAFRLRGGRWVEIDEPAVIALKETQLPQDEAANPLTRVAVAFDREPLAAVLARFRDGDEPVVVIEGVLPYLDDAAARATFRAVRATWPRPTVVCDLMTPTFGRYYGGPIRRRLQALGAHFGRLESDPKDLIEAAGFRLASRDSIAERAVALGGLRLPRWMLATLLRPLRDGYTVAVFEPV